VQRVSDIVSGKIGSMLTNINTWGGVIFNVKSYGAEGDGTTDDTVAIQSTIAAANTASGGVVYLPPGTFMATNIQLLNINNITFAGPGEIKSLDGLNVNGLILVDTCSNIVFDGIRITGKGGLGSGSTDDGITIRATKNYRITGCHITNFSRNATSIWGQPVYDDNDKYPSMIDNNVISGNYVGVLINNNAEYFDIIMNQITNNSFGVYGGFGNINVRSNQISYNIYGVFLDGTLHANPDHNSISGNKINHNRAVGLKITNVGNRVHVVDNQIVSTVGPETYGSTGFSYSLVLENVKNLQVIGNQVDGGSGSKIRVDGHNQCHYIGNTFFSGNVEELSQGHNNYFIGNTYIGSGLVIFATSYDTVRSYEAKDGVFVGLPADTINKIQVTSFQNSWANTGGGFETLCYWKDGEGAVHIQGVVSGGSLFTSIFTLPVEYRPRNTMDRPTTTGDSGLHGSLRIYNTGALNLTSGATTQVHIHASFKP
jgi:hypothetical protein